MNLAKDPLPLLPVLKIPPISEVSRPVAATPEFPVTLREALQRLVRHPVRYLFHRWNWKSAVLSSILRASLFFATNLTAGLPAAIAAMKTELVFRCISSGFYGALTEVFSEVTPAWEAAVIAMICLPLANHSIELLVHWMRGTHNLLSSICASMVLTALSTLFNLYLMRRGALTVGAGSGSLGADLLRLPRLTFDFITLLPRGMMRLFSNCGSSDPHHDD